MNYFYKSAIRESLGEYPEIDDIFKNSLKYIINGFDKIENEFSFIRKVKILPKDTMMIRNIVRGLDISIYLCPGNSVNTFVIPGYYAGLENEKRRLAYQMIKQFSRRSVKKSFWDMLIATQVESVYALRNYTVNPYNRTVIFRGDNLSKVTIFTTGATLVFMSPEQRCAVYLHELGHWVDAAKKMPSEMIKNADAERLYFLQQIAAKYYTTRYNEFAADKFVKEVGYEKELISALNYADTVNTSKLSKAAQVYNFAVRKAIASHDQDEESGKSDITAHPSRKTRIKYLNQ